MLAAKSRTVSGSSVMPRTTRSGAPKSRADFTNVLPHQPRPTIAVFSVCKGATSPVTMERFMPRPARPGCLSGCASAKASIFAQARNNARESWKRREIYLEEISAGRLTGHANVGRGDLLAVTIGSGFLRARQILLQRRQCQFVPVPRPLDDARFIDLESWARYSRTRGTISGWELHATICERPRTRARARGSWGSDGGFGCVSCRLNRQRFEKDRSCHRRPAPGSPSSD